MRADPGKKGVSWSNSPASLLHMGSGEWHRRCHSAHLLTLVRLLRPGTGVGRERERHVHGHASFRNHPTPEQRKYHDVTYYPMKNIPSVTDLGQSTRRVRTLLAMRIETIAGLAQ